MKIKVVMTVIVAAGMLTVVSQAGETPVKPSEVPEDFRDFVRTNMAKGAPTKFFKLDSAPPGQKWRVEYNRGKPIAYLIETREKIENGKTNTIPVRLDAVKEPGKGKG